VSLEPIVFVAVLAKQKEIVLPYWLDCLEALDYPKKRMILYVRSNNNTDATEAILRGWIAEHGKEYLAVYEVYGDVDVPVEKIRRTRMERRTLLCTCSDSTRQHRTG